MDTKTLLNWVISTRANMDPVQTMSAKHWVLIYHDPNISQFVAYESADPERFAKDFLASRVPDAQFVSILAMPARKAAEEFISNFRFFMPLCLTLAANIKPTAKP